MRTGREAHLSAAIANALFTAEAALHRSRACYGTHPGGGGVATSPRHPEVVAAREDTDAGPKPPGRCFQMCEKLEIVPDTSQPGLGKGGVTVYPRRLKGTGCKWICVGPF